MARKLEDPMQWLRSFKFGSDNPITYLNIYFASDDVAWEQMEHRVTFNIAEARALNAVVKWLDNGIINIWPWATLDVTDRGWASLYLNVDCIAVGALDVNGEAYTQYHLDKEMVKTLQRLIKHVNRQTFSIITVS